MNKEEILSFLPYSRPFLFVDRLLDIDENAVSGTYTFSEKLDFYKGHFKDYPVTPGVILTECMAQIGLVCLGIFLLNKEGELKQKPKLAMTSAEVEYLQPVYPGETVKVISRKKYFRFNKLRCEVVMYNEKDEKVCTGNLAGMILRKNS
ncbi:hydroxymyristoyl-ACP dehydratase [Christiangramia fulva]|uniref:Hydroxymyristoyl-ACP dehydratase n=1 Tax=Christiangramia fulva TaxID=2126553 RepID=A0A2R3Z7Z6_9FLAO|nr:3-hydroxyacyl-ACP dehydratase FabZ family protein [Christiangramia fulva]AVR46369.1 hydroxymyristoyl-ACP dehydratase [Christiangramia fulva]